MSSKSNQTNGVEVTPSHRNDDEEKMSFKDRISNGLASLRLFIYDKEYQTFFGQTSSSWIKISVYYAIFYICLGLFYCGMVAVFGAIVSRQSPRYLYRNNAMNDKGQVFIGMGFRPMTNFQKTSIFVYNDTVSQNATAKSLTNYVNAFLPKQDPTFSQECSPTEPASKLQGGASCKFSWSDIVTSETHPCSTTNQYGWPAGQPCVLIKLNKIYGWVPAPGNVRDQVANATGQPVLTVDSHEDNIFITCNGKEAADKAALGSNMTYYSILHPRGIPNYGGIPYYFFPYTNSRKHVQPFVLVQFTSLPLEQTVTVQCRAWAPNIEQLSINTKSRGMVTFTIFKSNNPAPVKT